MLNRRLMLSIFVTMMLSSSAIIAQPQTMYRCGSSYQDKPCANGQPGVAIGSVKASTKNSSDQSNAADVLDPACKRRGEEAKKIIWMREAGAQKSDLLAKSISDEQSQLIADIYAVRGNSNDIRASIEKNCMQERELLRGLNKRTNPAADAETMQVLRKVQQVLQENEKAASKNTSAEKIVMESESIPKKRLPCPNLKTQLEIVNANLRAGADAATMQVMQQQKKELEKDIVLTCGK